MPPAPPLPGIHHVTAITSDAQENINFYCGVLGLRLVKRTVNFDDPTSYHLYYGNYEGSPGTIITFFVWPGAPRGRVGTRQVTATGFLVPLGALHFWKERLEGLGVDYTCPERFGEQLIAVADPDGMAIEIIESPTPGGIPTRGGGVPSEYSIRGIHSVTLSLDRPKGSDQQLTEPLPTAQLLTSVMDFEEKARDGERVRYGASGGEYFSTLDLVYSPGTRGGRLGSGIVHHLALRTPDENAHERWQVILAAQGFHVTPIMDRSYFRSLYFRESGGVLIEIATNAPGFSVDEPLETLGQRLMLPSQFEPRRLELEGLLPEIVLLDW